MGNYVSVAPKEDLRRDNRVHPSPSTGKIWENSFATVRYEDRTGTKRALEGRLLSAEKKTRGHKFIFDVSDNDNVDADRLTVHTNDWDGLTAPISTGEQYNHPDRLGGECEVFEASQWSGLVLDGFTGVKEFDDKADNSARRAADYERRGEYATMPTSMK